MNVAYVIASETGDCRGSGVRGRRAPAGNRFGSVNRPENTRGYQEMCGVGFHVRESEYEVSFGLAPLNGELSASEPKTPEPFNSPLRARNPERSPDSNSPQKFRVGRSKLGVLEHIR